MKQILCTLVLVVIISVVKTNAQAKLPSRWESGMTLTVYEGPGMRPDWSKIIISDSACWYLQEKDRVLLQLEFQLSGQQLNSLLKVLSTNHFATMHKHQVPALWLDKGTTSLSLTWGNNSWGAAESASLDLDKGWDKKFDAIIHYVYRLYGEEKTAKR